MVCRDREQRRCVHPPQVLLSISFVAVVISYADHYRYVLLFVDCEVVELAIDLTDTGLSHTPNGLKTL